MPDQFMRHAQAKSARVALYEENGDLVLVVADDGKGFRESDLSDSLGLLGMKERAQVCGGDLEIASTRKRDDGHAARAVARRPVER